MTPGQDHPVTARDTTPCVLPLHQGVRATWAVQHRATCVEGEPFSGWLDVAADADTGTVSFASEPADEEVLEPDEARMLARALMTAADHAEGHHVDVMHALGDLGDRLSALMGDQPNEVKRAAQDALREAIGHAHRRRWEAIEQTRKRAIRAGVADA